MANAKELNQYTQNVRLIEPGDRVIGGTDAPINQPLQALANRTLYLKTQIESKIGNKGTQVIEGQLNIQTNAWEKIRFTNGDGSYWRFETSPVSEGENGARFNYVFTSEVEKSGAYTSRAYPDRKASPIKVGSKPMPPDLLLTK